MIEKIQRDRGNFKIDMYYYRRARDAMFDAVLQLCEKGYRDIFIPGYIGWSPREGSGIFDPLNSIGELRRHYYRMTGDLAIDPEGLIRQLRPRSILLIVNYFGFRDRNAAALIRAAGDKGCAVIEDNAHGFFTFFCHGPVGADLTFFSLHKMFPFEEGGGLMILNPALGVLPLRQLEAPAGDNPFAYDIQGIARRRKDNFRRLLSLMEGNEAFFVPFRSEKDLADNVPQTFPILIRRGDRNRIYEIMNGQGYGVVSLYHTMIEELRTEAHGDACRLAGHIMNLPLHQDCDPEAYPGMIEALKAACEST